MFTIERQQGIMNLLKSKQSITVTELSKTFFIGEATIRRDLEKLEKKGLLKRTYGGAILIDGLDSEIPLSVREIEQKDAKDIIGHLAAQMVENNDIVIMDSSSTVLKMVQHLKGHKHLTVITNGAKTAVELGEMLHIKVYSTGGTLRENSLSYIGEIAKRSIDNFYANTLFFSCRSISMYKGLSDVSEDEAELRKFMIKSCKKAILLCDSSKFEKITFAKICNLDEIDYIVTEKKPSSQWMDYFAANGVNVIYP